MGSRGVLESSAVAVSGRYLTLRRLKALVRFEIGIRVEGQMKPVTGWLVKRDGKCSVEIHGRCGQLSVNMVVRERDNHFQLSSQIKNNGTRKSNIDSLSFNCLKGKENLNLGGRLDAYRISLRSRTFEYAGTRALFGKRRAYGDLDYEYATGHHYTVIQSPSSNQSLLIGLGHNVNYPAEISTTEDGFYFDIVLRTVLHPGKSVTSDTLHVILGDAPEETMAKYAGQFPHHFLKEAEHPVAWNSWDYFLENIHQEDIWANMEFIRNDRVLRDHVSHIVVDMGWSRNQGDWVPNDKFSEGMERMARRIRDAGFVPGLWFAPFWVDRFSDVAVEHPEYLVKDGAGAVESVDPHHTAFTIDPTHLGARRHLQSVFSKYRKMGYEYFKIDFLGNPLNHVHFHDRKANATRAIRIGVETIREAIGQDAFLLGCTAPMESLTGLVDAYRITHDIAPFWSVITSCVRMGAMHNWMNGRLWINDPDFLVVRSPKTAKEKQVYCFRDLSVFFRSQPFKPFTHHRCGEPVSTLGEVRVLAATVLLSGGLVTLSDNLPKLNKKGLKLLYTILENRQCQPAVPLGMYSKSYPDIWIQPAGDYVHIGMINLHDRARKLRVSGRDLAAVGLRADGPVTELLSGNKFDKKKWERGIEVVVPKHDALVFKVGRRD